MDRRMIVGLQARRITRLGEERNSLAAYPELSKVDRKIGAISGCWMLHPEKALGQE